MACIIREVVDTNQVTCLIGLTTDEHKDKVDRSGRLAPNITTNNCFWKCNFIMNPDIRLLVGWLVGRLEVWSFDWLIGWLINCLVAWLLDRSVCQYFPKEPGRFTSKASIGALVRMLIIARISKQPVLHTCNIVFVYFSKPNLIKCVVSWKEFSVF